MDSLYIPQMRCEYRRNKRKMIYPQFPCNIAQKVAHDTWMHRRPCTRRISTCFGCKEYLWDNLALKLLPCVFRELFGFLFSHAMPHPLSCREMRDLAHHRDEALFEQEIGRASCRERV